MGFFSDLHRSMFDPYFYREAAARPAGRVVLYALMLLVFSVLLMGASRTYYIVDHERGIAPLVSAMFSGMEIRDGRLVTEREQPFEVPGDMLAALISRFVGDERLFERAPANFMVVDARTPPTYAAGSAPQVLLGETAVEFREMGFKMPYEQIIGGRNFLFTVPAIQEFLNRNIASLAAHFFIVTFFYGFFTLMLSVFFLSLAAWIFSVERARGVRYFARLAAFAISPVMLGTALVSLSGVSASWTWHVFIVISTLLMFRALMNASTDTDKASEEKREVL